MLKGTNVAGKKCKENGAIVIRRLHMHKLNQTLTDNGPHEILIVVWKFVYKKKNAIFQKINGEIRVSCKV